MIRDAFGLIYAGEEITNLRELVDQRTVGAMPIGGKYRAIDFPLSNIVNSDVRSVGVIVGRNYNSLMDHLGSGKEWDLSRKGEGLFILTPFSLRENPGTYRGKIEAIKSSMDYLRRVRQEYCILADATSIYNFSYDDMMRFHIESGADITALYQNVGAGYAVTEGYRDVFLDLSEAGRVCGVEVNPVLTPHTARSLKSYIVRKDILMYLVDECYAKGEYKFSENLIRNNVDRVKIMAFEHKGYVGMLRSASSYFRINMDMLDAQIRAELFPSGNRIYTKSKDSVPAKYAVSADAKHCLVANECIIEGIAEKSVLFRDVRIGKGAKVKNSIILAGSKIEANADLEYVILDKNVTVRPHSRLVGSKDYPVVIRKGGIV